MKCSVKANLMIQVSSVVNRQLKNLLKQSTQNELGQPLINLLVERCRLFAAKIKILTVKP